jgi:uncharacterized membrane protein YhaH (DUF805 family)
MTLKTLLNLRLGRRGYWNAIAVTVTVRILLILAVAIGMYASPGQTLPAVFFYCIFAWLSVDLWPAYAWRLHDLGRSGWTAGPLLFGVATLGLFGFFALLTRAIAGANTPSWAILAQFGLIAAPIGSIAFTVWLGLLKGDEGDNRFERWKSRA